MTKSVWINPQTDIIVCGILSKHIQMFLDDVGVTIAMITVTLLAVCVVLLKVLIFSDKVWSININTTLAVDMDNPVIR